MNTGILVFFALLGGLFLWGVTLYNRLVLLKNNSKKAWSNIDVLLKQRNEELPKLISVCKEHMKYEQETLQRVIAARTKVDMAIKSQDIAALGAAEAQMQLGLGHLFAVAEDYPELKASEAFLQLQARISMLEDSIADRREFYNDSAAINNTRIEQFPDIIIARMFSFKSFKLMRFSAAEKQDVNVAAHFNGLAP
ncbi:MAG: LemA family protein [Thiothrix sp.]|nr:LemA family protein [Thiothrix sp.]HPQ95143.1 LemA family protein [Thiolinea sp.]